jgi:hypothetical protein
MQDGVGGLPPTTPLGRITPTSRVSATFVAILQALSAAPCFHKKCMHELAAGTTTGAVGSSSTGSGASTGSTSSILRVTSPPLWAIYSDPHLQYRRQLLKVCDLTNKFD